MPPTRRPSTNGRSPLVRKQSQITTFFSPGKTPSPSPSPNPNSNPSEQKPKKTPLLISSPPSTTNSKKTPPTPKPKPSEAVGKKIRVFWPLDKTWYDGQVKSFDRVTGKHRVRYDDAEEEDLDLDKEKIEWVEEEKPSGLRRLRRVSKMEVEKGSSEKEEEEDSDDEDWGKKNEKDVTDDDDDVEEVELDDEEEEEVVAKKSRSGRGKGKGSSSTVSVGSSGKRKKVDVEKLGVSKKFRFDEDGDGDGDGKKGGGLCSTPASNKSRAVAAAAAIERGEQLDIFGISLRGDAAERFGKREAEKFRFIGERRKDAKGRRPGDPNYDPRTLYLPNLFLKSLSGGQRQWWEFKSKHMDKVLFFKMGKFYELFEMDAHIGAKELDLQYMKGEQPHCGFPEKNFSINLEKLARKGYRVLVVEQTETPEQLELRRKNMGSKDKVVKREICAMVTKGTLTEGESLLTNPESSYLMSITENSYSLENQSKYHTVIGICVVDVSTSKFMIGQLEDDVERHCLCSILSELRPVEIIKPCGLLSLETEKVINNHSRNPLINNLVPSSEFWDAEKTIEETRNIYKILKHSTSELLTDINGGSLADPNNIENSSCVLPDVLSDLVGSGQNGYCALSAFGGCLFYLRNAFLDEALLKCAKFEKLPCMSFFDTAKKKPYMILDAAALDNLEILENNRDGGHSGTLFGQLDHCVTSFGKRLLKSWLARPLYDRNLIVERQDAIAGCKGIGLASALEFRKHLLRLPDMERLLARLFASCHVNGRNAKSVVLYEDAAKKQLQEFITALRGCQVMVQACSSLSSILARKGLPDISSVLKHFQDAFDWSEANRSGRIIPHEGGDIEYDNACGALKEIESRLKSYLKEQKKLLRDSSISYVTIGKDSYLLEVPESLSATVPQEDTFDTGRQQLRGYLSELSLAEEDRESKLKNILQRLLAQFSDHHGKWRQLVSVIAELDVLVSLSIASDYYEGPTCRPIIKEICHPSDNVPSLSAKSLGHPLLRSDALGKGSFVPNDVTIGGNGHATFILLTGPNMGGKSTLLRQVCMAVILAQLGADVPADSFEFTPVDRIFVRMGARDHIMSGQSTFLMELSETASILSSATQNSLVALDELGRGTSTSDGQAIAGSVLDYLVHKVQCRGFFSTHYHRLAVEYEKDAKVSLFHMSCQVGKGIEGVEEVTFLYRLAPGSCPKSYGVNVARLAGIPTSVLENATAKSSEFEVNYGKHRTASKSEFSSLIRDEEVTLIQDLLGAAETWNHHQDSQALNKKLLGEIQQRARSLVQ